MRYLIQVASFEDDVRAASLVQELTDGGYRAYQATFDLDGETWWQVSVGPYGILSDAQSDVERIRSIPGYEDAAIRSVSR